MSPLMPNKNMMQTGFEFAERHFDNQETIQELLKNIADNSGPGVQTLAITERELGGGVEVDFPVEGGTRWLIPRLATGGSFEVPEGFVQLLEHNNRRLGGTIVNRGTHDVILILASAQTASGQAAGLGEVFLKQGGGSWDFRLGSLLWCGSVCARALGGESIVTITEV